MLWACLLFSDLPLRAVYEDGELAQPCAVVDGPRQRPQIVFTNAAAKRAGANAGRVLAAARALCSTLQARQRDRASEQRLLSSLAAWAYRFSSQVSLSEPDALLIEIGASLRLFGGWPALERRLREELATIGYRATIAVTPVPAAARVLAAQHDGFFTGQPAPLQNALGFVPVAQSGLPAEAIALLYNVGARRLRDVFALPRPELARRIGPAAFALLDRLRGIDREVLALYEPPDRFEHRLELDDRVEAWPPLLFPLRRLCAELALFLAARDGGVQRCELVLDHEDGKAATRVTVELLTPQREARTLYELVRSRLERVALAAPVCGIALVASDLPEFRPRHQDLFEPQREQQLEWPELAERLRAHLGDAAVHRLAPAADHRPEKAWRFADGVHETPAPRYVSPSAMPKKKQPALQSADMIPEALSAGSSPLPQTGKATPPMRAKVAPEAATAEKPPPSKGVSAKSGSSPLLLAGEAAPPACATVCFEDLDAHQQRMQVGRVRVAPEAAATEKLPRSGSATLTPALSRQRERENDVTAAAKTAKIGIPSSAASGAVASRSQVRPLWLLSRAMPLRGPAPTILAGPERIESGWWDGGDTRRDYYVVQTREGQRAWAYLVPGTSDGWMLHGWFA